DMSRILPRTILTSGGNGEKSTEGRSITVTRAPRLHNSCTRFMPMKPAPPVTTTFWLVYKFVFSFRIILNPSIKLYELNFLWSKDSLPSSHYSFLQVVRHFP